MARWIWSLPRRFAFRLTAAMLLVTLPLLIMLAVVLTTSASNALTAAAEHKGLDLAKAVTLRLEDWLDERRANLVVIADEAAAGLERPEVRTLIVKTESYEDFSRIKLTDLDGNVLTSSQTEVETVPIDEDFFKDALAGQSVLTTLEKKGDDIQWIMAEPVLDPAGVQIGVLIADLNVLQLDVLLNPDLDGGTKIVLLDSESHRLYDTDKMINPDSDADLFEGGVLVEFGVNPASAEDIANDRPGAARFRNADGNDVIGGYDIVSELDWVVVAQEDADLVLAPAVDQRNLAIIVVTIAILLALLVSLALAWRTSRPIKRLTKFSRRAADGDLTVRVVPEGSSELVALGTAVNQMLSTMELLVTETAGAGMAVNAAASELSASSEELAATTTQQSAAVTQATVTTEELARASAAIAETVDGVARQTADTRDYLEQAEADITLSSERTLALAGKINEIDALRVLINDIADQTNLLALNAAIEAARAGEHGLGFAVVADEVRRLAERSKKSAGSIASIVSGVQTETTATVLAMEKGAKQMHQGLMLLAAVTDAAGQVRLTTQQQRSANGQVVETMEQLTDASRQVSATASQIAAAAGDLANLAGDLETTSMAATGGRR